GEALQSAQALRNPKADRYCGIQVAAGDVSDCGDHDADGESVRDGDAEQADAALRGGVKKFVGDNRASAYEDKRKRADEFSDEFSGQAIQVRPPQSETFGRSSRESIPRRWSTARILLNSTGRVKRRRRLGGWRLRACAHDFVEPQNALVETDELASNGGAGGGAGVRKP